MVVLKTYVQVVWGILCLSVAVRACTRCGTRPSLPRIINGKEAFPHSWPWMAYIEFGRRSSCGTLCGGSLITKDWILTAAHCLYTPRSCPDQRQWRADEISVSLGVHSRSSRATTAAVVERTVSKVYIINSYKAATFDNDVALLKLSEPVKDTNEIRPICPVREDTNVAEGTLCTVTGWGVSRLGSIQPSDVLMEASVRYSSAEACRASSQYPRDEITDDMLCAAEPATDSCLGDSGGPLMCAFTVSGETQWKQLGIVSFGRGCARPSFPGVYTDVRKMANWIYRTVAFGACGSMERLDSKYYVNGPNIETKTGISERECEEACINNADCKAATFRQHTSYCWLHAQPRGTGSSSGWVVFRRRDGCQNES
ncbi:chymotrypsin-like protease CTRL-1 [Lingula anatina]|uniref:Chymotrypsin-like protease CTRL-1 n=1 Tax=Lingula anatina TaxID=7574 RepID=A0A1S3H9K2_LINAN|nr:chymotrypsin-like protease CTRL-1 [Lingula anatina]|eukprot:XP_013382688.1 chymotrypsin-like protease CTRL-1 [Lingula anatina]